jgi:glutamyl-Q tRNA(Asp) synthetase
MTTPQSPYLGRFAPTPSGHLHFGSLVTALASYLDARHQRGHWLVRMEDLDGPRNKPGAAEHILQTLKAHGLIWDGEVLIQSQQIERYQQRIQNWISQGLAYYCDCSRTDLSAYGGVYPGFCRERGLPWARDHAVRLRVTDDPIAFTDRLQGKISQRLESEVGDFVIRRRDGVVAYQLAVVMDDIDQGVTQIVRGADLLDSTPRQLWLYQLLKARAPEYLHIPLLMARRGHKLSKRLDSAPIEAAQASVSLYSALVALQQQPPAHLQGGPISEIIAWAIEHWQPCDLPATREIVMDEPV